MFAYPVLVAAIVFAAGSACAMQRVYPQYEGLDVNVYLTVTPKPKGQQYGNVVWRGHEAAIVAPAMDKSEWILQVLAADLAGKLGRAVAVNPESLPASCDLVVTVTVADKPVERTVNSEGYRLAVVVADGRLEARITGNSLQGCQHGLQALRQLVVRWKDTPVIREAELTDWPSIPYRFVKRATDYWFDQAARYRMNGGTIPVPYTLEDDAAKAEAFAKSFVALAQKRHMGVLGMVAGSNVYSGREDAIQRRAALFATLAKAGFSHIAMMNDDRMTLMDAEGLKRFKSYYDCQLHYFEQIREALRAVGYRQHIGYMPNHYYGPEIKPELAQSAQGRLGGDVALFWCGLGTPGPRVTREHLELVKRQIGAKHLWFYSNFPQCGNSYYAEGWMPIRHRDFGTGELVELVTVSTDTRPEIFPVGFITMCDLLWNPEGYDPDRSLILATKEVVDPESFPAFYALFKFMDSIAPIGVSTERSPMYAADDPAARRAIVENRCARQEALVAACRATPAARQPDVARLLDVLAGHRANHLKQLAEAEASEAQDLSPRRIVCPIAATPPALDGRLDDAAWAAAGVADGFTDLAGKKAAPQQTTLHMVRTADTLYLSITCQEPFIRTPEFLDGGFAYPLDFQKDQGTYLWWSEEVEIFFDAGKDRRDVTQLLINPWGLWGALNYTGVKYGYYGIENQHSVPVRITGKLNKTADAWIVECAIPFADLGGKPEGTWGFNIGRTRQIRAGEGLKYSTWTPLGWGFQDARHFGLLTF